MVDERAIVCYNKIMIDCHVHTDFSSDGKDPPEALVLAAIEKGISFIAFTDHLDLSKTGQAPPRMRDLAAYCRTLDALKQKYASRIEIAIGAECGWAPDADKVLARMLDGLPFDYIINSIHDVNGADCYDREFYDGKSKQTAYREYLSAVFDSLDAAYPYHAIGHLCYPERVAPYPGRAFLYTEFSDIFDALLKKIIDKQKILELNTSVSGTVCLPRRDVLARYRALGGEKVTFSSDAHFISRLCDKYAETAALIKELGFSGFTYIAGGKERLEPV